MIEKLVIHRFRGIREGVLDDIGKVNFLIGPNNSGKSAILELLYLSGVSGRPCHLIMESADPSAFAATTTLQYDFLEEEPLPRLRMRHKESAAAEEKRSAAALTTEGSLAFSLKKLPPEYPLRNFVLAPFLDELDKRPKAFSEQDRHLISLFRLEKQTGIPQAMIPPLFPAQGIRAEQTTWHYLWEPEWVYRWEQKQALDHLAIWAASGTLPDAANVLLFDFHTAAQHFTKNFFQRAYPIPDWYEKIAARFRRVFPELKDATVDINDAPEGQEGKAGYVRPPGQTPLMIDHFGDGARHAFKVLTALITLCEFVDEEHPGLFLWEDPELFMHPATLARLLDEVMALIAEKPIQLFVTTQSLELLAWLVKYLEQAPQIASDRMRTFRLDLVEGTLQVHPFIGKGISGWFRFFGDPRLSGEDEMASPLSYLLAEREVA